MEVLMGMAENIDKEDIEALRLKFKEDKIEIGIGEHNGKVYFVYFWLPSDVCLDDKGKFSVDLVEKKIKEDGKKVFNKISRLLNEFGVEINDWMLADINKLSKLNWDSDKNMIKTYINILKEIDNEYHTDFLNLRFN